ncbi:MAG TPA: AbrB/MazE/SpoVT family DNA-binding domain-containing protein [Nevskiaceae bacterium]|nr:AbrB/MazE/SpoVT family DNA-binding domain-containing protein [Nevskiaceae bacterium]
MIQSIQKIIKIGSSGGVTIPAKDLKRQNIQVGDEVKVTIEPAISVKHDQLMNEYDKFVEQYGQTLKNLANK